MDTNTIEKVLESRAEEINVKAPAIFATYKLYEHELMENNGKKDFDENYYRNLVETTSPVIERLYEEQNEDGSLGGNIYDTAVFVALMCVTSRVYDVLDSVFARDCMHAGLDAAHYLFINKLKPEMVDDKSKAAVLWAFSELSKTDKEIKNAYDHSMMAGMPQKMSRQKKYKYLVNEFGKKEFNPENDHNGEESDEGYKSDMLLFSCMTILLEEDNVFTDDIVMKAGEYIFNLADAISENGATQRQKKEKALLLVAILCAQSTLYKDMQIADSSDSQLIKVIEYNIINQKKKRLSEEEKKLISERIEKYHSEI